MNCSDPTKYPVVFIPTSVRRSDLQALLRIHSAPRKKMNTIINSSLACDAAFRRRQFLAPLRG